MSGELVREDPDVMEINDSNFTSKETDMLFHRRTDAMETHALREGTKHKSQTQACAEHCISKT